MTEITVKQKAKALAMLREGKAYREIAEALGLSYAQVYQQAVRTGIAFERSSERRAAAAVAERERAEKARADRVLLRDLIGRYERGELVPDEVMTYGDVSAKFTAALLLPGGPRVKWELDESAPLNRSEQFALDKLTGIEIAGRDRTPLAGG